MHIFSFAFNPKSHTKQMNLQLSSKHSCSPTKGRCLSNFPISSFGRADLEMGFCKFITATLSIDLLWMWTSQELSYRRFFPSTQLSASPSDKSRSDSSFFVHKGERRIDGGIRQDVKKRLNPILPPSRKAYFAYRLNSRPTHLHCQKMYVPDKTFSSLSLCFNESAL